MTKLIHCLLKAGVEIDGTVHPTNKGVPQGGVASPLLANAVLNKLDWFLHSKGFHGSDRDRRWSQGLPNVRFARYADDWCAFLTRCDRQYAERLRDEIRDFLRETCGLELSAEKTQITHVRDGYDFLGFNISLGVGKSGDLVPKVRVGRKATVSAWQQPATPGRRRVGNGFRLPRAPPTRLRRPQVEGFGSRRLSLPRVRCRGYVQDFARGPYRTCQPLCQPRDGERLGQHPDFVSALP